MYTVVGVRYLREQVILLLTIVGDVVTRPRAYLAEAEPIKQLTDTAAYGEEVISDEEKKFAKFHRTPLNYLSRPPFHVSPVRCALLAR